jgi:thiol-disulfide isomerase/thioredoxin
MMVILAASLAAAGWAQPARSLVGQRAPEFALPDLAGEPVDLARDRGEVVLLNFWATWCAPCLEEMPHFAAWQKQYAGLRVIGVSIDDSAAPVRTFVAKLGLDYPVVMGDARLGERYGGILGVPVTFLIDRRGVVRARFDGEPNLDALERRIRELLAEERSNETTVARSGSWMQSMQVLRLRAR